MDGNNSDKHLDGAGSTDKWAFECNYLINPSDVDVFADDGVARSQRSAKTASTPLHHASAPNDSSLSDEPVPCTANGWVAANGKSAEEASVFDITGPFICVCRHGFVETLVEMRRSGEL
jgi:hypothetical protein